MKYSLFSNQMKTGGRLILLLAILILNFAGGGVKKAYAVTCYTLTIIVSGGGTVNASPAPPDINCGTQYTSGTVVTLTASPNANYNFVTWTGALSSTTNPETVTMNSNKSVTATFAVIPANDDFTNATVINSLPYPDTLDIRGATTGVNDGYPISCTNGNGDPVVGGVTGIHSVWYTYTADPLAPPTSIVLDTIGSDFDTFIAVWTDAFLPLGSSSCNDDTFDDTISSFTFTAIAGNTYYIEIGAASNTVKGSLIFHAYTGTSITVKIGGTIRGVYDLTNGQSQVKTYSGVLGGPVVVQSQNGTKIIASMQQLRRNDMTQNLWPGIIQVMGIQAGNLSDTYVIPRYTNLDPATKYEIIPISNFDTIDTNVTVKIGNTTYGPYPVPKGTIYAFNLAVEGGPVVVSSDNGAQIIASLYQLKRAVSTNRWTGQSEMMGIPLLQLSDTYVFPFYDYTSLGLLPSLNIANADSIDTNITVTIGGDPKGTYPMPVGTSQVVTYQGILGGPVVVSSDNGAKIVASTLQLRRDNLTVNLWTGIAQAMGMQAGNLSDTYVIPRYTNLDPATKYEIIPISNFDTIDTNVTVKIGNTTYGPYPVPKGTIYAFNLAVEGGPVVVSSDNGAQIIASLYQLKRAVSTNRWNDQSEMMGIPLLQLSETYVFPFYDYTSPGLLPSLNFAVP